jgi:HipA-like protein
MRRAEIYVGDHRAGILEEADRGYRFAYLPEFLASSSRAAVSFSLPLRAEP